jgi:tetratricopeptide (TPR) repeat protein
LLVFSAAVMIPAQEATSLESAEVLLKQAIEKKNAGAISEAVSLFEKAIRTNRGILGYDDEGLILELRHSYEKKLETTPEDIAVLEPLGYVYAVCFSDFEKAIAQYKKVVELTKDEKVKERTQALIDRLNAQWEATRSVASDLEGKNREEKVKEWKELEKQEALAAISDRVRDREERMRDLNVKKDEMEARLPQEEDRIKEMEEEVDKADLFWRTTENRMYRRKRERLSSEADRKKGEVSRMKRELEEITRNLDQLQKEAEAEQNLLNRKTAQGGKNPGDGEAGDSGSGNDGDGGNGEGGNGGTTGSGTSTPASGSSGQGNTGDPVLPPANNPDFPTTQPEHGSTEDLSGSSGTNSNSNSGGNTGATGSPESSSGGDTGNEADPQESSSGGESGSAPETASGSTQWP